MSSLQKPRKKLPEKTRLAHLRRMRGLSQVVVSDSLCVTQPYVSKIESQSDMRISSLRQYIEALGGELKLVAHFPQRQTTEVSLQDGEGEIEA